MESAIAAVRAKKMGLKKASKEFNVPKTTLGRRVRDKNKMATGSTKVRNCLAHIIVNYLV